MQKRFVAIWFKYLKTDWLIKRKPALKDIPFVLAVPFHGKLIITEANIIAKAAGIMQGMAVADARVLLPAIEVINDKPKLSSYLLTKLCHWCIRFTPIAAMDAPDGIILDATGCAHLWGGEEKYLKDIIDKLKKLGVSVRIAIADTIGTAWAVSRYGKTKAITPVNGQVEALMPLPPAALRLDTAILQKLHKLGFYTIGSFMNMQRRILKRRFGDSILLRLDEALGFKEVFITPVVPIVPYEERLTSLEPIQTKKAIEIALQTLLDKLTQRLIIEGKGLRNSTLQCYRIDNNVQAISITTNHASHNAAHLFKLFEIKIGTIEPALGIEVFVLQAGNIEEVEAIQEKFWSSPHSLQSPAIAELLDNLQSKFGNNIVRRYLPGQHYLPENAFKLATSLKEQPAIEWRVDKPRPILLLKQPCLIQVTAPVPDYPPMNFRYNGKLHRVAKADACERIEAEWWLQPGLHRDYYIVEDEEGKRYWLYRLGHYDDTQKPDWYLHGFFA